MKPLKVNIARIENEPETISFFINEETQEPIVWLSTAFKSNGASVVVENTFERTESGLIKYALANDCDTITYGCEG